MPSNQKLVFDFLISMFTTFILTTTILSITTTNWNINTNNYNRTGLFQQCLSTCCCQTKELNRTVTMLIFYSIILLLISTFSSFTFMVTTIRERNRLYVFVPLTLFGAGISMTLTFMQIHQHIRVNGYSGFIFLIDIILSYVIGGITILHGSLFYF